MKQEQTVGDYLAILIKWRSVIIFNVLVITLLSIAISLLLPKKWTAETTILPPSEEAGAMGIPALFGGSIGGILGGGSFSRILPGMSSLSDLFAKELESRRIMLNILEKHDLVNIYKVKLIEDGLRKLEGHPTIEVTPEGIIEISVTEKSAKLAADIANSYVRELDKFNREVNMTLGKKNRLFLEERLETVTKDLHASEESLRAFKEKHKTVSLSKEMIAAIEVVSNIKAQIISNEVKLGMLYRYSLITNPEIIRLQSEIIQLKRKEQEIELIGKGSKEFGVGFSIPFSKLPQIALELARKERNLEIQGVLYKLLTQQYEQAKIMEVRDTHTVQVLDRATPPEKRSFPKRRKMVIVSFILSIFVGTGLAFLFEYSARIQRDEEGKKWLNMGNIILKDLIIIKTKLKMSRRNKRR